MAVGASGGRVVYVAGEESPEQVKLRAERLGEVAAEVYILPETDAAEILAQLRASEPALVLVDSVQTLFLADVESAPGSVSQIRETSAALTRWAKQSNVPVVLIGHITKEGSIAGPKVLEHMVDVVLTFEGERHHAYRMLRAVKNRFGTTAELGLYEMRGTGLAAVDTPSDVLLAGTGEGAASGVAVAVAVEGARPFLVEVQALVSSAVYGTPQRSCTGFDVRRLNMLLAVLEKRCGFKLATRDVFLNIAGGLRIADPALDLAVVAAVLSSSLDLPLPGGCAFAGEVGLSGEIRPVSRWSQRWGEAHRMGLERLVLSGHTRETESTPGIERVLRVAELHRSLF
jgi:DNA repair protein RadA/Sms